MLSNEPSFNPNTRALDVTAGIGGNCMGLAVDVFLPQQLAYIFSTERKGKGSDTKYPTTPQCKHNLLISFF